MGTKITKSNVRSAIKDDKAHIDYLKRDVKDDQRGGGRYKDINQTADEKHISKLAGDIKADGHFLSKHWNHSSPLNNISMVGAAGDFGGGGKWVDNQRKQQATEQGFMEEIPNNNFSQGTPEQNKKDMEDLNKAGEIQSGDDPKSMAETFKVTDEAQKKLEGTAVGNKIEMDGGTPNNFVDVVSGEVDGVAYGAADVDGHIAVDTSTVGYDDTMNLP